MPKKAKKAIEVSSKSVLINGDQKRYLLWSRPGLYGKSIKRYFVTKGEAEAEQKRLLQELDSGGKDAITADDGIGRNHRADARRAIAAAGGRVTLETAVKYWIERHPENKYKRTLGEALDEFYGSRLDPLQNGKAVRASTLGSYKKTLNPFAEDLEAKELISEVTKEDIVEWASEEEWALATQRFHVGNLKTFFRWAMSCNYVNEDPTKTITKPKLDDEPIEFLSLIEARSILQTCLDLYPECTSAVSIGLFCGLRQSELKQLIWSEIKQENGQLEVTAAKSKTRSRRLVALPKNLKSWLKPRESKEKVVPPGWRDKWVTIRSKAGVMSEEKPWIRNGLRHSYASYYLAASSDEKKCAEMMGNSPEVIYKHYRGLIKNPKDVTDFWKLTPELVKRGL